MSRDWEITATWGNLIDLIEELRDKMLNPDPLENQEQVLQDLTDTLHGEFHFVIEHFDLSDTPAAQLPSNRVVGGDEYWARFDDEEAHLGDGEPRPA